MFKPTRFFLAFVISIIAGAGTAAHADCIPISSVPFSISQSGSYCVTADLSLALSNGEAIAVWASDVDIDFQGYTITNTTPSAGTAGVHLMSWGPVNNVTVHNGALYSFDIGINATNINSGLQTSKLTVDHMKVMYSKSYGISLQGTNLRATNNTTGSIMGSTSAVGINLTGNSVPNMTASNRAVVQGNVVSVVKVSGKNPDGTATQFASATGIYVGGFPDILIRDNVVSGISAPIRVPTWSPTSYSRAVGIQVSQLVEPYRIGGLIIQDNTVQNNLIYVRITNPNSAGIQVSNSGDHAIITGSKITGMTTGIETGWVSFPGTPPMLLLNNTITGATTPIDGGPINGTITLPQ